MFGIYFFIFFFQPSAKIVGRIVIDPVSVIKKFYSHRFISLQPLSLILAFYSAFIIIRNTFTAEIRVNEKNQNSFSLFVSVFFLAGFFLTWLFKYDPTRYYLLIIVPQIYLTSYAIVFIIKNDSFDIKKMDTRGKIIFWLLSIYTLFQISKWAKLVLKIEDLYEIIEKSFILEVFGKASLEIIKVAIIFLVFIMYILIVKKWLIKSPGKKLLFFLLTGYFLFYFNFLFFRSCEMKKASNVISSISKPGEIIAGDWAPAIAFDSPVYAIYISRTNWNFSNLEIIKPDYIMANDRYEEIEIFNKYLSEEMKIIPGNEVYRFKLGKNDFGIWKMGW